MKLYLKSRNDRFDAIAEYNIKTGAFIVLKGSRVSDSISTAPTFRGAKAIEKQRLLHVMENVVQDDVVFRSASTAGNFVTGNSTDGLSYWKDVTGKKLKQLLTELKE